MAFPLAGPDDSFFFPVFQNVSRLAIQFPTDGFQCGKTYGFGFSRFQNGEVGRCQVDALGQRTERDFPLGHHYIQIYDYGHVCLFNESNG